MLSRATSKKQINEEARPKIPRKVFYNGQNQPRSKTMGSLNLTVILSVGLS